MAESLLVNGAQTAFAIPHAANANINHEAIATATINHQVTSSDSPNPSSTDPTLTAPSSDNNGVDSYFNPYGRPRQGSVTTLARASFAYQLSQLTSMSLPDAEALGGQAVTAPAIGPVMRELGHAAAQIQNWIQKAAEVLGNLDADDDVEWAAAGGRDGLVEMEGAITTFESLVKVYIAAVEAVQTRPDFDELSKNDTRHLLDTLEQVCTAWFNVNASLKRVREQVAMALEWEELWNVALGEVGQEISSLNDFVFELETKRHRGVVDEADVDAAVTVDLKELQTIVEEVPANGAARNAATRIGVPPLPSTSSSTAPPPEDVPEPHEPSSLLALIARMQPLRASLDFLPMRIATYQKKAEKVLPSACEELVDRHVELEKKYQALMTDVEALRQELGEDRWVIAFKTAGRQAQKMCESVERGMHKLQEALDARFAVSNPAILTKKIGDYEAKKINYGPAIQKVIAVIEKGLKDRLTINGEILRIHAETRDQWTSLEAQLAATDARLADELARTSKPQPMRDSISTTVSNTVSAADSSAFDTPGSSPASSIHLSAATLNGSPKLAALTTPEGNLLSRRTSNRSASSSRLTPSAQRHASAPALAAGAHGMVHRPRPVMRLSTASPGPRAPSATPSSHGARSRGAPTPLENRPRWNANPKPLDKSSPSATSTATTPRPKISSRPAPFRASAQSRALTEGRPSVYSYRSTPRSLSIASGMSLGGSALPSPLGREHTASPTLTDAPSLAASGRGRRLSSASPARSLITTASRAEYVNQTDNNQHFDSHLNAQDFDDSSATYDLDDSRSMPPDHDIPDTPRARSRMYIATPITPGQTPRMPSLASGRRASLLPLRAASSTAGLNASPTHGNQQHSSVNSNQRNPPSSRAGRGSDRGSQDASVISSPSVRPSGGRPSLLARPATAFGRFGERSGRRESGATGKTQRPVWRA